MATAVVVNENRELAVKLTRCRIGGKGNSRSSTHWRHQLRCCRDARFRVLCSGEQRVSSRTHNTEDTRQRWQQFHQRRKSEKNAFTIADAQFLFRRKRNGRALQLRKATCKNTHPRISSNYLSIPLYNFRTAPIKHFKFYKYN